MLTLLLSKLPCFFVLLSMSMLIQYGVGRSDLACFEQPIPIASHCRLFLARGEKKRKEGKFLRTLHVSARCTSTTCSESRTEATCHAERRPRQRGGAVCHAIFEKPPDWKSLPLVASYSTIRWVVDAVARCSIVDLGTLFRWCTSRELV